MKEDKLKRFLERQNKFVAKKERNLERERVNKALAESEKLIFQPNATKRKSKSRSQTRTIDEFLKD